MQGLIIELEKYIIHTKNYITEAVTKMLEQELPVLTWEKFALFQTTGNRLIYEKEYFAKRKFLTVFGVAAQWMKQEKLEKLGEISRKAVIQKLEETLCSICTEECWALPAHVNCTDPNWRHTIDLFATETAQTLSDIVDMLKFDLNSQCVALVREQVNSRVLQSFFEAQRHSYGWETCDNNWNAVCNGNIGSAYLHSQMAKQEFNWQYISRITDNLLHYWDGLAEDGTCKEGLGYYFYGMTYMVNFANELYTVTKGQQDLLRGSWGDFQAGVFDKRRNVAEWFSKCFFSSGRTVSFSDGNSREKYRMGLACALAEQFDTVQLPNVKQTMSLEEDPCYRYLPFKMDFFCTMHYLEQLRKVTDKNPKDASVPLQSTQSRITILPKAQWCMGENIVSQTGFACKGGNNEEPHNHNDVGSFLYVSGKDMFLTDLGAGEYTKEYFSDGRYDILCNRSLGHNVPLIAGEEQLTGVVFACTTFEAKSDAAYVQITMDLTKAYREGLLKNFTRRISFDREEGCLVVEDVFQSDREITITENLVTQFPVTINENRIQLQGERVCQIQLLTGSEEKAEVPRVIPMEHRNHQGERETVYLIQWHRVISQYHKECFKIEMP